MAALAFPVSFRDPQYAALDDATSAKLGLPPGLLPSIRLNGERSNADQVSEDNARTPYQIIPATRQAAIKKWGIDPYLSAQNASEVAGLLLKDSLTRNKGDVAAAAAEYHGGTDQAAWGAKTRAYVQRVIGALPAAEPVSAPGAAFPAPTVTGGPAPGQSTFDKALAQMQQEQAPSQLRALYEAYQSGQMTPAEAGQYEADVRTGAMMLPRGATLKGSAAMATQGSVAAPTSGAPEPLPPAVLDAYRSGAMTPQDMVDLEKDVRAGIWQLPGGASPDAVFGSPEKPAGVLARIADTVTGNLRSTPQIEAMKDWTEMPSLNVMNPQSVGVGTLLKLALGTMASGPQETAQMLAANIPGLQVQQDKKGNFSFIDPVDGQPYGYKPGLRLSDAPRAIGTMLAFTPASKATTIAGSAAANAATQAAIEGTQAQAGGNFDTAPVVTAGVVGAAIPAAQRLIEAARDPIKALINRVMGRAGETAPVEAAAPAAATTPPGGAPGAPGGPVPPAGGPISPGAGPAPAGPGPVSPVAAVASPSSVAEVTQAVRNDAANSVEQVAQTARRAAMGSAGATQELAAAAAPSPEIMAAADRLGIRPYLQSDHVTTSDAYRQVLGIIKSNPASVQTLAEKEGLSKVAERAAGLIDDIGGTRDLSMLDTSMKTRMTAAHTEATNIENRLYTKLREVIPPTTPTPAPNTLAFLKQQAADLGGEQHLSSFEKAVLAKIAPKDGMTPEFAKMFPATAEQAAKEGGQVSGPTYALMDNLRQTAGRRGRLSGAFSDADTGLANHLYGLLSSDQETVANALGQGQLAQTAKAATVLRKGIEGDMAALFGKNLEKSIAPQLSQSMQAAAKGNTAPLLAVLKSTPDEMKQEVVASGLSSVFRNAATRGEINFTGYWKWYQALRNNQQAYAAVMSNLPKGAPEQLADLALVSKGISDSLAARIKTGLRSSVMEELGNAPDTLATRLFDVAKGAGKGLAVDTMGGHGAGLAMGLFSAINGTAKPNAIKAIDELLVSPEFQQLASSVGTPAQEQAVRSFAYSKLFTKFARAVGNPRELSNRERWVLQALESGNAMHSESKP